VPFELMKPRAKRVETEVAEAVALSDFLPWLLY